MEFTNNIFAIDSFLSVTLAIFVLFTGKGLTAHFPLLRGFNIPEPVVADCYFLFYSLLSILLLVLQLSLIWLTGT